MKKKIIILLVGMLSLPGLMFASGSNWQSLWNYDSTTNSLYRTDLYGGTDADLDNTAPVDDTDGYTAVIDLTRWQRVNIAFQFTPSGATDSLVLTLYKSVSGTFDGTEIAIDTITVANAGVEQTYIYDIGVTYGAGYYRFSLQSAGATDTFDIEVNMRYFSEQKI